MFLAGYTTKDYITYGVVMVQKFSLTVSYSRNLGGGTSQFCIQFWLSRSENTNFISALQTAWFHIMTQIKQKYFKKLPQLIFSMLVSMDKITDNISMDKSKWCVTGDGNIRQNEHIL